MRTILINPAEKKRGRNMAAKKPAAKNPATPKRRRRKKNPTGLTPARLRELGGAAAGGAVGGLAVGMLEKNKPPFLAKVPTEALVIAGGFALEYFAKGTGTKHIAAGMVGYGAGTMAARYGAGAALADTSSEDASQVKALHYINPASPAPHSSHVHVGSLTFAVED